MRLDLVLDESNQIEEDAFTKFKWKVTSFEERIVKIKVSFDHPEYISAGLARDTLYVKVLDRYFFISKETNQKIDEEYPKQSI